MAQVPCVLYSLPYSEPRRTDGVILAVWSSLTRFFSDRIVWLKRPHNVGGDQVQFLHRTALHAMERR